MLQVAMTAETDARPVDPAWVHLVRRLQRGDDTAAEGFIAATQAAAFRLAYHVLGDYHAAQDALQDAYVLAFREIHRLKDPRAARAWLLRIVSNRCLGQKRRIRASYLEDVLPQGPGSSIDPGTLAGQRIDLQRALASLNVADRTVIVLREFLDCSYEEMAQALDVPLGTAKRRLCEARRRLAHLLKEVVP